ncbi:hypothetical protein AOLI_G00278610 [Acnodon oligacanthus]
MTDAAKRTTKMLSEESRKRKRERDRARDQTRVNIRLAFTRWRELKEVKRCENILQLTYNFIISPYATCHLTSVSFQAGMQRNKFILG